MTYGPEEVASEFVEEYLQREVEFMDVLEFLYENDHDADPASVHALITAELDTILQRWLDRDS